MYLRLLPIVLHFILYFRYFYFFYVRFLWVLSFVWCFSVLLHFIEQHHIINGTRHLQIDIQFVSKRFSIIFFSSYFWNDIRGAMCDTQTTNESSSLLTCMDITVQAIQSIRQFMFLLKTAKWLQLKKLTFKAIFTKNCTPSDVHNICVCMAASRQTTHKYRSIS